METADIFTFYQNGMQSSSFAALEEMRRKGQFCDLTIKVQNHSITAHRNIVAAGIPYFQSAFDCFDLDTEEKEIAVQDNLDPKALESLILFAYTSKVDITSENVQSLLVAAQFLELDQVQDSCTEFLSSRLNIHSVVQIRELANTLNNYRLLDNCNLYIRQNFQDFSKTLDFKKLPFSCVKEIISKDDLVIPTEEVVFEAVVEWVKFFPSERQSTLQELLTEIRMTYLPIPYLKKVDTEEIIVNSKPCRDLINEVKYYHLLPEMFTQLENLKTRSRDCLMRNLYAVCSYNVSDSQRLLVFILANKKWLPLSSMELKCAVHNVVAVNGKIYMLLDETIVIFDPRNQKWEVLKQFHESIAGASTALYEEKIYCFGAENDKLMNKMRYFDTQSNQWSQTKEMKTNRWDSAAASLGEFIYVTGGYDGETRIKSVEKYCPSRDTWEYVAPMLTDRDRHGCISLNEKIYVCGGVDSLDGTVHFAEVYNPLTNQWAYISSMQISKIVISLVPHCGRIYAFGETDIEVYDPERDEWEECSFVPVKLCGAVSISTDSSQNGQS